MAGQRDHQPEPPWTPAEKNYLLAEIIKAASPDPNTLLMVIVQKAIQPAWEDMPLPPGRSLNSCRLAFDQLQRPPRPMLHSLEPRTPLSTTGYPPPRRPYEFLPGSREIRPKPTSGSGYSPVAQSMDQPPRKKRGRPTKAEAQAKAEAQTAGGAPTPRSEGAAPSSAGPAISPVTQIESPVVAAAPEPPRPILPPTARVAISSIVDQPSAYDPSQPGSSGKRKRGRSTRSDPESLSFGEGDSGLRAEQYESPYLRMEAAPADSPARAAVLRHREDAETAFRPPAPNIPEQSAQAQRGPRSDLETK